MSYFTVSPWHAFNQSYFQYVRTEALHFDAGKHCEEQNGWLVSISSEDERTFLVETFILVDNAGTSVQYSCTVTYLVLSVIEHLKISFFLLSIVTLEKVSEFLNF